MSEQPMKDPTSGLEIRRTDNGLKPGDPENQPPQTPEMLELDPNGHPIGVEWK